MAAKDNTYHFLRGGGESGELISNYDWASSSLGPIAEWPLSLRTTLGIVLHSAFPMFLMWGDDLICFYNDAFRPSLGNEGKHPAIGLQARVMWAEIWEFVSPLFTQVMTTGKPVFFEDQLVPFYRNGRMEDIYWTFSYSPVFGDNDRIEGIFVACTETTSLVNALRDSTESDLRFRDLVDKADTGVIIIGGEEAKIELANEAYGKIIGRKAAELNGKKLFELLPEAKEHFKPIYDQIRSTKEPLLLNEYPYFVYGPHGEKIKGFLNLAYRPYTNAKGEVINVMVLCHDVTEQITARNTAIESEQQIRALVESAPFPIGVYTGKEMRITLLNKAIMDVWGKGHDGLIGRTYADVLPELKGSGIYEQLDDVFTTGKSYHAKNQQVNIVVDERLQSFYFNYSFTPLYNREGKIYGVMNTAADVTDLALATQKIEHSEKNFRNIILNSPVAMCIMLGPEHTVSIANDAMITLWGKPKDEVMNKPIFEGLPDAKEQGLEALLNQVYVTGESFSATEMPVELLRNGVLEIVYQNFVYEPYKDENGNTLGVLAISVDVSEQALARLKIEELVAERTKELATANHSLQRSNEELEQFAYIASHDLQEPLRKVSTFSQMLEQNLGNIDEKSKNYLDKIKSSAGRMTTLIRDVLAYSQLAIESNQPEKVDLQNVVNEIREDFELLITQKNAQINCSNLPVISAIPLQMLQLFGNLLSNSLKFSRTDIRPEININSRILKKPEKEEKGLPADKIFHLITVSDNGIGFESEYAEKIFNIFQRLHGRAEFQGTGIGLAMCKKIIQNHGGEIMAYSTKGSGAAFDILLPG